jgi:hypothetical protein
MRAMLSTIVAVVVGVSAVVAQQPAAAPGPEHKRLEYFLGQWDYQGEVKDSPLGPGGKNSGTETCEWFAGGFHLVCRTKGTGPKGASTSQGIMGYDMGRKAYTYHAISNHGDNIFVRGNVSGKVWTWTDEMTIEGKPVKVRATVTEESATSYSFKLEVSAGGGPMTVVEEGKSTKKST